MPWLEERTLTLFVRDTEVRRYEPGVRERGVDVERPSGPLMGSADTDTDPDRALTLKAPVIHGHLIRQHFSSETSVTYLHKLILKERNV
ncbi:sensory box ggdef family protein [Lasius niger]|uniref:Sensory box ggdef family protein n=1 Tax=Lasius niger TaxID=67767 RepID=A0A0J7KJV1_LASNI|nr:sensory box ggdef family protein [Lasius niger]